MRGRCAMSRLERVHIAEAGDCTQPGPCVSYTRRLWGRGADLELLCVGVHLL